MATRDASICRSVIQAGSSALSPYSPKDNSPPRQALPRRRPRCCLRYFTFFGINIKRPLNSHARRNPAGAALDAALGHVFALVDPALHANHAVGGVRLRESEIDVGAQCLQRQAPLQVPLLAGDFRPVQAARDAHLDALAAEAQR